ncbi:MAG: DUF3108 domain-containing protein, partial [Acidobacteria bacterium]|nr:DUF3108 domain-containing protein [Acidobacteriota bacterium]
GALVVPVALPYLRAQQIEGFGRNLYEAANHAASLQSYTQVPPANLLYGRTGLLAPRAPGPGERDRRHVEHQMFPGITALLLALAGAAIGWRRDQRVVVAVGVTLVIAGGVLSMGPEFPGGLYQVAASTLPGFDAIRAPARFGVVVMLGLSLLAAVGLRFMLQRAGVRRDRTMLAVIIALVATEYANAPMTLAAAPVTDTVTGRWLRDAPEPGAVVYLPVGLDIDSTPVMLEALQHGRPIVNGYSGQRPSNYVAIAEALSTLPAVEGLAMLRELDVRFVVSDRALDIRAASSLIERARVDGRVIYEVAWTPDAEAALLALDGPDVPPPGAIPFVAGEILTFAVRWIGDVPAGTITLRTEAPSAEERTRWPHAAWRFVAAASTAPWVSRFFEARDVFTTIANDTLLPIAHLRQIDEGARKLTRAYVYDGERRQVRTAATVEEASSTDTAGTPWSGAARDAISTLYYVRTLDLDVGREWRIPVNDAGRSLLARVSVEGRERVTISGASVDAWRLRVVIERRLERRQPVSGTLWLSADAERAPLGLDIAAGFGAVHVERVDYRP